MGAGGQIGPLLFGGFGMPLRTAVFVDGANFRGNLRDFSFTSTSTPHERRYRLEERHFDWESFFSGVIEKFDEASGWEHRLIRVHWYYAESISPWIASQQSRFRLARRIVDKHHQGGRFDRETLPPSLRLAETYARPTWASVVVSRVRAVCLALRRDHMHGGEARHGIGLLNVSFGALLVLKPAHEESAVSAGGSQAPP
jgi:hypothetical protein